MPLPPQHVQEQVQRDLFIPERQGTDHFDNGLNQAGKKGGKRVV